MHHRPSCTPLLLSLLGAAAAAEDVRLPVAADTSIAADARETRMNYGGDQRIKLKGIENFILVGFDAAPLAGKVVERATLHLRGRDAHLMVRKVGLSTVATAWSEGTTAADAEAKPGESCFLSPALGSGTWAGPGSCFLDAIWGRGGTIHLQTYVTPAAERWYPIAIDGRLLEACASGLSSGLCLSDDNGQTKAGHKDVVPDSNFSNNYFHAREQADSAPYITATCAPAPKTEAVALAVEVAPWPAGADAGTGGLSVGWPGPASEAERAAILGYRLRLRTADGNQVALPRWMHPTVPAAGERARALLAGQPAAAAMTVEVEVVGRGGAIVARGTGRGTASPAPPAITALVPAAAPPPAAGAPPADDRGLVFAIPDLAKANPLSAAVLEEPGVDYAGAAGRWSEANPVWSGAQRTVSLAALRGEWVAFQLVCSNRQPSVTWRITPGALQGPGGAAIPAAAVRLARTWYQKVGTGERDWFADPLLELPAGGAFTVPDARNAVPGQTCQTVHVELFVPKDAAPGSYAGSLQVATGDGPALPVAVQLQVGAAVIPDRTAFTFSMNAYSSPGAGYGEAGSDAFLAAERSFYRMAHEHRTTLAVLGYSHRGTHQDGVTWPLAGSGAAMRVADWSAWDRRYGPLFDGSAFAGTPRAGVPLDHFYLPLMENWPTTMADGYKWNDVLFEQHWKVAGPVEEGFSQRYREQWIAVLQDLRKHVGEKQWQTSFQIYLNDKYFYKQYDAKKKAQGQGSSFWLLDEPMHIDDFDALAFFGRLTRQAQQGDRRSVQFRADISRPQWGRDALDRVLDVNVTGGFANFRPWLEDVRERHGQRIWTYGGAPSSRGSAYGIVMQAIDLYSRGVDGFVPWLTLGGEKDWTAFADTTVFYTGKPMGVAGACASLRLKAYRRGEQDIEYLRLLAAKRGLQDPNRRDLAALIAGALDAKRTLGTLDAQGAVTESFSGMQPAAFEGLRRAISAQLDGK